MKPGITPKVANSEFGRKLREIYKENTDFVEWIEWPLVKFRRYT